MSAVVSIKPRTEWISRIYSLDVKLTPYILVPRLRMSLAVPPLPQVPSWRAYALTFIVILCNFLKHRLPGSGPNLSSPKLTLDHSACCVFGAIEQRRSLMKRAVCWSDVCLCTAFLDRNISDSGHVLLNYISRSAVLRRMSSVYVQRGAKRKLNKCICDYFIKWRDTVSATFFDAEV
jgi:hypothetical protein